MHTVPIVAGLLEIPHLRAQSCNNLGNLGANINNFQVKLRQFRKSRYFLCTTFLLCVLRLYSQVGAEGCSCGGLTWVGVALFSLCQVRQTAPRTRWHRAEGSSLLRSRSANASEKSPRTTFPYLLFCWLLPLTHTTVSANWLLYSFADLFLHYLLANCNYLK